MKKTAIIPLRSGSKGIPGKNKKKLLGRSLYQWVLGEAIFSELDEICIFTDDHEILEQVKNEYHWTPKVKGMLRSDESAGDSASTEDAMLEFAEKVNYNFDIICLLQATSPLTHRHDINKCINNITKQKYDSALTVVETKRFIWNKNGESLNYNFTQRPRRQDFEGLLIENGAVYASSKKAFKNNKTRLSGKISVVNMPEDTLIEIDEISDWIILEKLVENRMFKLKKEPSKIKAFVFDVDGVFTDGTVAVSANEELFKTFSLRDGMGIDLLKQNDILPIVMTSEFSPIVKNRMNKLKINHSYLGVKDKFSRLEKICNNLSMERNEIAYMGDDINDLPNLCSAGWSFCPQNAIETVKPYCDLTLNNKGGDKAIREAVEFIIKQNKRY
jgi:N-acylneuraminate cytidylyltransferase